ncbi:tyrosyl-DNA phosphodiesterase 1 [Saccharomyces paradoxus]|uniref:Tyrosyl-DNA phosphodiesterase 1 n=1 Tax=Saccharomyces paradoxus TaxID=27291 RepID=A0A8B8UM27_SACPA|nr:Tdp1 [Saccharomyces paradoxus]QHS71781.1 Tdp1 [Saccharomyces paradoxus]
MSQKTMLSGTKRKRSEVAEKVAQRWKSVRYSGEIEKKTPGGDNNNNDDCVIVSESNIIDLTDPEKDLDATVGTNDTAKSAVFKLMKSDFYERGDLVGEVDDMITLNDIFCTEKLKRSILFSFQYELDFLLRQFHPNVENITIVGQKGTIMPIEARSMDGALAGMLQKVKLIEITMPPYASHHTKLIINFYDNNECKIFLPSNNFTAMETNLPQQVCWCSPVLKIGKEELPVPFKKSLTEYLKSYHMRDIDELITKSVEGVNFAPLSELEFVYSTPSKFQSSGLLSFYNKLEALSSGTSTSDTAKHYLCQTSSIGTSLSRTRDENLWTHLMIPLFSGIMPSPVESTTGRRKAGILPTDVLMNEYSQKKIKPYIIFPTEQEFVTSPLRLSSSGWFHFQYLQKRSYYEMLRNKFKAFYKQDPVTITRRRGTTPAHSKFYMHCTTKSTEPCDASQVFKELEWCLYTSANLSQTAWGTISRKPRNYEAGVLYHSHRLAGTKKVTCRSFTRDQKDDAGTTTQVAVPFTLPVVPYDLAEDDCFCLARHEQD